MFHEVNEVAVQHAVLGAVEPEMATPEELGISRNAVFDNIKRAVKTLEGYEAKLQLLEKHLERIALIVLAIPLIIFYKRRRKLEKSSGSTTKI